jgi:hypothetical protein
MLYVKSLGIGLVAAVLGAAVQAVVFYRSWSFADSGAGFAGGGTDIYAAPFVILFAMGTVIAWSRLRRKRIQF